ncbi:hypothetical protein GW756_05980 [bacterium]|nr:hypothetical protein [bacterium]
MKKLHILISLVLVLGGCSSTQPNTVSMPEEPSIIRTEPLPAYDPIPVDLSSSYLPADWHAEGQFMYSPEMYDYREDGPFSLYITINGQFSTIDEYLADKGDCVKDKTELTVSNYPAVHFVDFCAQAGPKITAIQKGDQLFEAFSHSLSDESAEITKILESLLVTK